MLTKEMEDLLQSSQTYGWVMEPFAKKLFAIGGMNVPQFIWAHNPEEAISFTRKNGYPVVMKIVSPQVVHKSDVGGVTVGIDDDTRLTDTFNRMRTISGFSGVLVEEMVKGFEMIVGATQDEQFGPIILLGLGGTATEIYRDISLSMAPLCEVDVDKMIHGLKAAPLLDGFRGSEKVNKEKLTELVVKFSEFVMDLGETMESIDLNPVMCSADRCVIADARIMLRK